MILDIWLKLSKGLMSSQYSKSLVVTLTYSGRVSLALKSQAYLVLWSSAGKECQHRTFPCSCLLPKNKMANVTCMLRFFCFGLNHNITSVNSRCIPLQTSWKCDGPSCRCCPPSRQEFRFRMSLPCQKMAGCRCPRSHRTWIQPPPCWHLQH